MKKPILSVQNLKTYFYTGRGVVHAVNCVNLDIYKKETVGLVGETGCGKSVTALSIMRLVPRPGRIVSGKILWNGENILLKNEKEMRKIRGAEISMIFQDPMTFLNPVYTIGDQIASVIKLHQETDGSSKKELMKKVIEVLKLVKLPNPDRITKAYPHELSRGMQQRALIAMMLSCQPTLLIADEPTTALDVTIQAQILDLLTNLKKELDLSSLFITHDLGIVAKICDRVVIMYAGIIVEVAKTRDIFRNPIHPYTKALFKAIPKLSEKKKNLEVIPGFVPDMTTLPEGCSFHPRCPLAVDDCRVEKPQVLQVEPDHRVRCHLTSITR